MFSSQIERAALVLAVIIPAIFLIRWWLTSRGHTPDSLAEQHKATLRRKHARGEISEAEFQRQMRDLESD